MGDPILTYARALARGYHDMPCSVLTALVLAEAYSIVGAGWYEALNIYDRTRPWSPITAAARLPHARVVDAPVPGRWHLVQLWKELTPEGHVPPKGEGPPNNGHAVIAWGLTPERVIVLESGGGLGIRWGRRPLTDHVGDDCGPELGEAWTSRIRPYKAGARLCVLPAPPERTTR